MKKYRIKSKFRFTIFLITIFMILVMAFTTVAGTMHADGASENQYQIVKVQSGDTLWDIASKYAPNTMDVREVVYDICETNHVSAESLSVGQELKIPEYDL